MDASTLITLLLACAPQVHSDTAVALVRVESGLNPWAIGVVGGVLERQPRSREEAVVTARSLRAAGWNFSVGLGQINVVNFTRLGVTLDSAFEPCRNLGAMQTILVDCFERAHSPIELASVTQSKLRRALSCYYSGNFMTGFRDGYVQRVVLAAMTDAARRDRTPQLMEKL